MNLPTRIKVGPVDYAVVAWPWQEATTRDKSGECDRQNLVIRVMDGRAPAVMATTLLHETMHAIAWHWGLHNIKGGDGEEEHVWQMSEGMATVLRDNPPLLAYLTFAFKAEAQ